MNTHILVIDDEESIRYTFENFLKEAGYRVTVVREYSEALRLLDKDHYHLIITDIILGGKTGLDILSFLKQKKINSPVVLITGYPSVETAAEAVKLGALDYIMKPVTKDMLLRIVKKALPALKNPGPAGEDIS
ncbi:MAG: response regulator [Nitrospiraceae bacterium]|nr:MAG: response regulator [Nitrospiraceae bacterium]